MPDNHRWATRASIHYIRPGSRPQIAEGATDAPRGISVAVFLSLIFWGGVAFGWVLA